MNWTGQNPKTAKEYILVLLSQKWPLTAHQLAQLLRKNIKVTYQAVHKALNELVAEKVLVRSENEYQLNPFFVQHLHKHWEAIENKLLNGRSDNVGFILGSKIVTPTASYSFGEKEMNVSNIPSVFISQSTLQEFVHFSSKQTLDSIARFVALKDLKHIQAHLATPTELKKNPLLLLDKLNQLANDFYWGKVSYRQLGNNIELQIESTVFTSPKARLFYERLYEHFMELLGYKKKDQNPLENTSLYVPRRHKK